MPKFLPKSQHDYAIPNRNPRHFTEAPPKLLQDIGRKMDVSKAETEGRIPSPFSRAYLFYLTLYAKGLSADVGEEGASAAENVDLGRKLLREEARQTFRGLCAAFALRDVFDLDIRLEAVRVTPGQVVEDVLLPAIEGAPRGGQFWNPIRFYTVRQGNGPTEVLAGVSPLTGIYPSATPLKHLTCLYWYESRQVKSGEEGEVYEGRWYDPTSTKLDEEGKLGPALSPHTRTKINGLLRLWVSRAVETVNHPGALVAFGVSEFDRKLLRDELVLWQRELGPGAHDDDRLREDRPTPLPRNAPPGVASLPFLDLVCDSDKQHLLSDLPVYNGMLLVTRDQLLDRGMRLYGRQFGKEEYQQAVEQLPTRGSNLGVDLGLDAHVMPVGYVFVDSLFAHKLTFLTDTGFSDEWRGLEIDNEQYLLPFKPEILDLIPPEDLAANTRGELDAQGQNYIVRLRFGKAEISQVYDTSGQGAYVADSVTIPPDTFDLRLYPNFDLEALGNKLPPDERQYYARVRLAPNWNFRIGAFRYDDDNERVLIDGRYQAFDAGGRPAQRDTQTVHMARVGTRNEIPREGHYASGETLFITCDEKPSGFYVEDRGLCLVRLPRPSAPQTTWEVGVDFGTSNTCVTYRTPADTKPRLMDLPVFTTTLFKKPSYEVVFQDGNTLVNEGASAVLDFFTKQYADDTELKEQPYFPTQFVTLQQEPRDQRRWDFENGLVYFKNISLESPNIWELIERYPVPEGKSGLLQQQRFRLKQDIKWQNTRWLEAFMRHLRKQVLMTAAYNNATVGALHFSYPKAFNVLEKGNFRAVLRLVWQPGRGGFELVSESEAVRNHSVRMANDYIIFDVGGGTTDVIAFSTQVPVFQTSFKLAARQINQFVTASASFRKAFLEATKLSVGIDNFNRELRDFPERPFLAKPGEEGYDPQVIETIWLGLLEVIEKKDRGGGQILDDVLNKLRGKSDATKEPGAQEAVKGFFLSVVLLFGGLSYYAGTLLRAAAEGRLTGKPFSPSFPHLLLFGNGSKLYRMVDHYDVPFSRVIKKMLQRGMLIDGPDERFDIRREDITFDGMYKDSQTGEEAPKVTVALGLLTPPPPGASGDDVRIPVANVAGESGYSYNGSEAATPDTDLLTFYRAVDKNAQAFQAPKEAPERLRSFLSAMSDVLPKGNNRGVPVVPGIGTDWHEPLLREHYRRSTLEIRTRVIANARLAASQLENTDEDDMPALEPLFIIELASLLDRIREAYSGS